MQASVNRMSRLIDNILDFARGRLGGGLSVERSNQEPIRPMLEQVIAELKSSNSTRSIEATFDIREPVNCDVQRVGQLFSNLLGNAIAHGSAEMPIRVRAATYGSSFELSVANGGDPITPTAMERLFQPFYRGEIRASLQGLGLGLFIASEIAKAHGGTLEVEFVGRRNPLHVSDANKIKSYRPRATRRPRPSTGSTNPDTGGIRRQRRRKLLDTTGSLADWPCPPRIGRPARFRIRQRRLNGALFGWTA